MMDTTAEAITEEKKLATKEKSEEKGKETCKDLPVEKSITCPQDMREFRIPLTEPHALDDELDDYMKTCETHGGVQLKRKNHYVNMGLMAKLVTGTTEKEFQRLLENGVRTFLIDLAVTKLSDFNTIISLANFAIDTFKRSERQLYLPIGLAVEIQGDYCRIGRLHNNCSVLLRRGDIMTLTTFEGYKYCSFREIAFVFNLSHYLGKLSLGDVVLIGKEVRTTIVKILKESIAVYIDTPGLINSFEYLELPDPCYDLNEEFMIELFKDDLNVAKQAAAHYILLRKIRNKTFLSALRKTINAEYNFRVIGALDLEKISSKMLDLMGLLQAIDFLWIPDMFSITNEIQNYVSADVLPIAKSLKKPIIGSIPLEDWSEFKLYENHEFLFKIDSVYIEKSRTCGKYPLIVKKLLPIRDFRQNALNAYKSMGKNGSFQSLIEFIIRIISTIECQAIFIHSKCLNAIVAMSRPEISCPVYAVMPVYNESELIFFMDMSLTINLLRNVRTLMYSNELNINNLKPIEFGIEYARQNCLLNAGDFIIALEICKEGGEDLSYRAAKEAVILRCFFLPTATFADKFKYY